MTPSETVHAFLSAMEKMDYNIAWREYFDMAVIQSDIEKLMAASGA